MMTEEAHHGTVPSSSALDLLATVIADDGPAAHEPTVAALVAEARATGVRLTALDVLADPARPEVIRQRAFAAVHAALLAAPARSGERHSVRAA